jgi:arsenical pump membrane protein
LLVGVVAERDGLFARAGAFLERAPVGTRSLYLLALLLVATTTAVLNLDTSVFFLTPVLLHLARRRGVNEAPFLYGAVFMSNAASLFLPGSNLTNLIVLHGEHVSGLMFFDRMWAAATAAAGVTAATLLVLFRRELRDRAVAEREAVPARLGLGAAGVAVCAVLVLVLAAPALPVLAVGALVAAGSRVGRRRIAAAVDVRVLLSLLALAVLLGGVGRWWRGPETLVDSLGRWQTALLGAGAAVGLNNLPAAVLLTPDPPLHARALLLGLNLGPNLAITGSLSAFLWLRVARSLDAQPSALRFSRLGAVLVPVSLGAALAALWLVAPGRI